jgi:hypothetical protein
MDVGQDAATGERLEFLAVPSARAGERLLVPAPPAAARARGAKRIGLAVQGDRGPVQPTLHGQARGSAGPCRVCRVSDVGRRRTTKLIPGEPVAVAISAAGGDPLHRLHTLHDPRKRRVSLCRVPARVLRTLHGRLTTRLGRVSGKSALAEAIRHALRHWMGLALFLEDGRLELDTNDIERAIRPIALGRRNSLFAGSDGGARHWAIVASLVATAKLNGVEPQAWLTDVLERVVSGRARPTNSHGCYPGPGRPSGSRPPSMPEHCGRHMTLASCGRKRGERRLG